MITFVTIILLFAILPLYLIWRIWKNRKWKNSRKWLATAMVSTATLLIINVGDYIDFSDSETLELDENDELVIEESGNTAEIQENNEISNAENNKDEFATVRMVIDGDTIELDDGRRVRYIGIDAPEMGHGGKAKECLADKATNENKKMVLGKEVILEKDISEADKYGRLLRYVYVGPILINEYLIDKGLAKTVFISPDISYFEEFKLVEDEAREEKKGMWADNACKK